MTTMTQTHGYRAELDGAGLLPRLRRSLADWQLYRITLTELERLTERDLADLGISRYDIPRIARETVYGG
jgi:uncharacterized protein YjiS (DUF1127 family)